MESDKILMAAGVTVAAVVGAFVLWGPPGSSRLRQRRGQIAGLYNFGQTCFLNTLLQALAACPQFIAWLQLHDNQSLDDKSLIRSLLNTLEVINGTHATLRGDPYSPGVVMRALSAAGWVIPQEEHDAHELFHVMLASMEEEANIRKPFGSLMDALPLKSLERNGDPRKQSSLAIKRPSSAISSHLPNSEYMDESKYFRLVRSEAHTPDSPASINRNSMLENATSISINSVGGNAGDNFFSNHSEDNAHSMTMISGQNKRPNGSREQLYNRLTNSYRSLERLNHGPGRVSIWSEQMPSQLPSPFQGALGMQIVCNDCNFKSTVRYDKFDSITLNLPVQRRAGLSLGHLLSDYISSEKLTDVTCENCHKTSDHTKSVTFAKLPTCLCIHIARTIWLPSGEVCKRQDYVHFPESLSMAPYSFIQPHLSHQQNGGGSANLYGSSASIVSSSLPISGELSQKNLYGSPIPRNLYRLLAVVVHSGEANSGHFVTYRRGVMRNSHRWYHTSDTNVKEVSIDEVLNASAYLIFYDRSPQRMIPR